jgi:hypothetical protein
MFSMVDIWSYYYFQDELLEGYKREQIDPTPYYWYTDQVLLGVFSELVFHSSNNFASNKLFLQFAYSERPLALVS